jgi:hypothetical protein
VAHSATLADIASQPVQTFCHDESQVANAQNFGQDHKRRQLVETLLTALNLTQPLLGTSTELRACPKAQSPVESKPANTLADTLIDVSLIFVMRHHGTTLALGVRFQRHHISLLYE